MLRAGFRAGDRAPMAVVEYVGREGELRPARPGREAETRAKTAEAAKQPSQQLGAAEVQPFANVTVVQSTAGARREVLAAPLQPIDPKKLAAAIAATKAKGAAAGAQQLI